MVLNQQNMEQIYEKAVQKAELTSLCLSLRRERTRLEVETGHLEKQEDEHYVITDKGRETVEITHDSIAFPVKHRAKIAVERLNRTNKREQFIRTDIQKKENGEYSVLMGLDDFQGQLMNLELTMPSLQQARRLEAAYRKNAEAVYQSVMVGLLEEAEGDDTEF